MGVLAVGRSDLIARHRLDLTHLAHLHLDQLPSLPPLPFLGLLLVGRAVGVPLDADQIVEHPVGGLKHILHSFVVDVHRGEEQF